MVTFTDGGSGDKKSFRPDGITSKLFLSSIKKWYAKEGVPLGIEKVGKPYKSRSAGKLGIVVKATILDMDHCLSRVIDEKDKVVTEYNASTDSEIPVTEEVDASNEAVTFFFNAKNVDNVTKFDEDTLLSFSPLSSAYSMIKCGIESKGQEVPEDKWITLSAGEMKYYLEGMECTVKYGYQNNVKGIKPYSYPLCENGEFPELVE